MERRDFFRSLIAGGATLNQRPEGKNRRAHHQNERLYHGPLEIPERIVDIVAEHPGIKRTTHRHLVSRYAENNWVWLFRCKIPASRQMVGEVVRTPEGKIRMHCWSAASTDERLVRTPEEIVAGCCDTLQYTVPRGQ